MFDGAAREDVVFDAADPRVWPEAERSAFSALLDKMETNVAEHFDLKRS